MKKLKYIMILALVLVCNISVQAKGIKKVSMVPIRCYYDDYKKEYFKPTKKMKRDANKIYSKMKRSNKKIKVKYKDNKKNLNYWNKVSIYMQENYFHYNNVNCSSIADGNYLTDIYSKNRYKKAINSNKNIDKKVKSIIKEIGINKNTTEYDAVTLINQWMVDNYEYNKGKDEGYNTTQRKYYLLMSNKGVCIDYAYTFQILCQEVGIKCGLVGDDEMHHAFNICNIDGKDYYFDVTWNDCGYIDKFSFMSYEDVISQNRTISSIEWSINQ